VALFLFCFGGDCLFVWGRGRRGEKEGVVLFVK